MDLVRARLVKDNCAECRNHLLEEAKSHGGLPLAGEIVIIPKHWLAKVCPHGNAGLKFKLDDSVMAETIVRAKPEELELDSRYSTMDATKNIGYPVREHGPYGSHPMHDDFDDESGPDGSGEY